MSSPHTLDAAAGDASFTALGRRQASVPARRAVIGGLVWLAVLAPQALLLLPDSGGVRWAVVTVFVYSSVVCTVAVRSPFTAWKAHPGQLFGLAAVPALVHVAALGFLALLYVALGEGWSRAPTAGDLLLRDNMVVPWAACVAFYAAVPGITAWVASGRRRWLSAAAGTGVGVAVLCLGALLLLVSL